MIIKAVRLRGPDLRLRVMPQNGQANPRNQPATAGTAHHGVGNHTQLGALLDHFQSGRALSRHDERVLIGRHQHPALALGDLAAHVFAALRAAVIGHHLTAPEPHALHFRHRRIGRHQDGRRGAVEPGRSRHALGMIARGIGDHAARLLVGVEPGNPVESPAEFERAGALQAFRFYEKPATDPVVQHVRAQKRRSHRMAGQPPGGINDILIGGCGQLGLAHEISRRLVLRRIRPRMPDKTHRQYSAIEQRDCAAAG